MHAIEMAFERIHVSGPEAPKRRKPGVQFLKRFGPEPIETPLCIHCGFDKAGFAQHAQVL